LLFFDPSLLSGSPGEFLRASSLVVSILFGCQRLMSIGLGIEKEALIYTAGSVLLL
jgi:hypothetical protein